MLFGTSFIIEFRPPSIIKVYHIYEDLYVVVNIYVFKESYAITTKRSKKIKKGKLQKAWIEYNNGGVFKRKGFGKKRTVI